MSALFEPIAVIGMAGRFPGAGDVAEFWLNLCRGVETVSFPADEELLARGVTPAELADPSYVRAVPLLPDVDGFDAEFFGMTPRDAEICDPQLRTFLEVVHSTIEDAGYDTSRIGDGVGVFGATGPSRYAEMYVMSSERYPREPLNLWTLNNIDYLSTLASYKLDLRGPSFTMATACSSSLVALHLACQSLRFGECDVAITGGSAVLYPYGHGHLWAAGGVKSPDGHCRPFDVAGTGTIFGNGAGAVMLKRLSDAIADGDAIRAVIRGTAINNDGADKVNFSAPSVTGQSAAIMQAMAVAGVLPEDISYVEAHGTGTALGDPVEVAALTTGYRNLGGELPPAGSIPIGSVKSNVGHLVWASGVASLMKVVLSLENEQLPATLNFSAPNPRLELDKTPFFVNDTLRPWPREADRPRRAGISSLGIGGANAHVVVEEGPAPVLAPPETRPRIVIWSGHTEAAADANRAKLAEYFAWHGEETFANAVATLQRGRRAYPVRSAAVCDTAGDAVDALARNPVITAVNGPVSEPRGVVYLFPGQGAQHPRMATGLYGTVGSFTETMDVCLEAFERHGVRLHDTWLGETDEDTLRQTTLAQPLLFAVEYSLAQTWSEWGVVPQAVVGHSIGEIVAATVAGVFSLEDAVALVVARAAAMRDAPEGGMLAVALAEDDVRALLPDATTIAAINPGPQTVVGGPVPGLRALAEQLHARRVSARMLRTAHAFHTPAMRDAAARFSAAFADLDLARPRVAMYSGATGARLTDAEATDASFWAGQLATPVLFERALDAVDTADPGVFLEVGPGRTLIDLVRRHRRTGAVAIPSQAAPDAGRPDDRRALLEAVARLWVAGAPVDWEAFNRRDPLERVSVPGYQYQRERYWVEPATGPAAPRNPDGSLAAAPETTPVVERAPSPSPDGGDADQGTPFSTITWVERPRSGVASPARGHARALALVPEDAASALAVTGVLQQAGYEVARVRPGGEFRATGDGEFQVRQGEPADMGRLVEALAKRGRLPDLLVHAWSMRPWPQATPDRADEQLDLAFFGFLALAQQLGRRPGRLPGILMLTTRSVDVTGDEAVDPVKATAHGLVRTLGLEVPDVPVRVVDVGQGVDEDDLIAELRLLDGPPMVALRGPRRWVRGERPCLPTAGHSPLRRDGVYLITGGLGGLGFAVAKGLAGTGKRPRLALLGRSEPAAGHDAVATLESLGAQVKVISCDVADRRAVARALDIVDARFGPLNGVLHLAGVAGDGMVLLRDPAHAREVLRPKVGGTLVLAELLAGRPPLDFFVSFSSRAALGGLVGGGDYAAGNAFLDAWSGLDAPPAKRRLSINWPEWAEVGMAAGQPLPGRLTSASTSPRHAEVSAEPETHHSVVLSADQCWALDEHRFGGRAVLPGTGLIDLVITAFQRLGLRGESEPVLLEEVVFEKPLAADVAREVRIGFTRDDARHRFQVASREHGAGGSWEHHAAGWIGVTTAAPRRLPVDEIRDGLPRVATPSFGPTPKDVFTLGPRWQGMSGMWAENGTKLVHIRLPEQFAGDLPDHPFHPAIMDLATALVRDRDVDPPHLPFLYRRLVLHAALPREVLSHIRRRPGNQGVIVGDIDVVAPDGTVLVEVEGFTMRLLKDLSVITGNGLPAAGAAAPPDAETGGIDPDAGVRAFLTLLDANTPRQVIVQPGLGPLRAAPEESRPEIPRDPAAEEIAPPVVPPAPAPDDTVRDETVPSDTVTDGLRAIWVAATGVNQIDTTADFFDIGGDSLSAVEVMGRVRDQFGVELSIGILFDHPTLGALAGVVAQQLEH